MGESGEGIISRINRYQDGLNRSIKKGDDYKVMQYLKKLNDLPINVSHLEETGVGRSVNSLRRNSGEVGHIARDLVAKWKAVVIKEDDPEPSQENKIPDHQTHPQQYIGDLENGIHSEDNCDDSEVNEDDNEDDESGYSEDEMISSDEVLNEAGISLPSNLYNNDEYDINDVAGTSTNHRHRSEHKVSENDCRSKNHSDSNSKHKSRSGHSESDDSSKAERSRKRTTSSNEDDSEPEKKRSKEDHKHKSKHSDKSSSSKHSSHSSRHSKSETEKHKESHKSKDKENHKLKHEEKHKSKRNSEKSEREDTKMRNNSQKSHKRKHVSSSEDESSKEEELIKKRSSKDSASRSHKNTHETKPDKKNTDSAQESESPAPQSHKSRHETKSGKKSRDSSQESDSPAPRSHKSKHETKSDRKSRDSSLESDSPPSRSHKSTHETKSDKKSKDSSVESDSHKHSKHKSKESHHSKDSKDETKKGEKKHKSSEREEKSQKENKHKSKHSQEDSSHKKQSKHKEEKHHSKDESKKDSKVESKSKSEDSNHSSKKKAEDRTEKKEHKSSSSKHKEKTKDKSKSSSKTLSVINDSISSESGASFAEVLGMLAPVKKPSKPKKKLPNLEKPSSSSSYRETQREFQEDENEVSLPPLLKEPPAPEPIDINISNLLPSIKPNYRPIGNTTIDSFQKRLNEEEALSRVISTKNQRTKVYSGNKMAWGKIPTLFDICTRVLQDNIDALEYTGGVPYDIIKPILEKATPDQLYMLEHHNPYIIEESDELWQLHSMKDFRTKKREELESWRDMYMRCLDEREAKLKALTANIKQSQDKSIPVRTTKLAYVDDYVKPPRNVLRQQAKHGTAFDKKPSATPASRAASVAAAKASASGEAEKITVPNPGARAAERPSQATQKVKPKKAPLMAKTLSFLKNRFKR